MKSTLQKRIVGNLCVKNNSILFINYVIFLGPYPPVPSRHLASSFGLPPPRTPREDDVIYECPLKIKLTLWKVGVRTLRHKTTYRKPNWSSEHSKTYRILRSTRICNKICEFFFTSGGRKPPARGSLFREFGASIIQWSLIAGLFFSFSVVGYRLLRYMEN